MRVALYWTPSPSDPLHEAGNTWLTGGGPATAAPRVYGFHATLRPPMRLATGWADFMAAAHRVAAAVAPFMMPGLLVDELGAFLALRETVPSAALIALAEACVVETDPHRRHADADELARRRAAGLSTEEDALLLRWGYPYVMQRWRFHMTLSGRLDAAERARLRAAAERHFAAALAVDRSVSAISVCTQIDGGDFRVADRIPLTGAA